MLSVEFSETAAKSESNSIEIYIIYTDCTADANADINLRVANKMCFIRVSKLISKLDFYFIFYEHFKRQT